MTSTEIMSQFEAAVALVRELYPYDDHVFVYDNATTHTKREDGAISARSMTKGPSAVFGPGTNILDPETGKPMYDIQGKLMKQQVRMEDGTFNGKKQEFYFPADHPLYPGWFKGMAQILTERGFNVTGKKAQCSPKFGDCPRIDGTYLGDCCCRRLLYSQPDFAAEVSRLEKAAAKHDVKIHFLPKFHCELNFIEQCWGDAKRWYRLQPSSSSEEDLEMNLKNSLDQVHLETMRRFVCSNKLFGMLTYFTDMQLVLFDLWMHIVRD
jgi:transposase